jgi:hypothetical protein
VRRAGYTASNVPLEADADDPTVAAHIAGPRHPGRWDGPHPDNLTQDTFDLVVRTVREIIDPVMPRRTFSTLETMPWIFPSSADEYAGLLRAIDRPAAVQSRASAPRCQPRAAEQCTASAIECSLPAALSEREVTTIGARAPTRMPALSARAKQVSDL